MVFISSRPPLVVSGRDCCQNIVKEKQVSITQIDRVINASTGRDLITSARAWIEGAWAVRNRTSTAAHGGSVGGRDVAPPPPHPPPPRLPSRLSWRPRTVVYRSPPSAPVTARHALRRHATPRQRDSGARPHHHDHTPEVTPKTPNSPYKVENDFTPNYKSLTKAPRRDAGRGVKERRRRLPLQDARAGHLLVLPCPRLAHYTLAGSR
ncbi:hypothetical protein E2C01_059069 [Portunus trituberculatus]|uniref:Uncharacterized protein n=1 Tax=Portunus trituberculatus TaxID=210409 RepID=A0A5B7H6F3_PORTR|nr:hypothetical protein [Portunus trituberculatus]